MRCSLRGSLNCTRQTRLQVGSFANCFLVPCTFSAEQLSSARRFPQVPKLICSSFAKLILLKTLIWTLYLETSEQYDHMSCGIYQVFSVSTVVHVCKRRVQNKFNCFDLILARYVRVWMGCMISPGLAAPPGPHVPEGDMPWVGFLSLTFGFSCGGILPFTQLAGRYVLMLSGQNLLLAQIKPSVHHAAPAQERERF